MYPITADTETTKQDTDTAKSLVSNTTNSNSPPSEYFRVKLRRGLIGLPDRFKDHTRSLGLRHTHQKVYLPICSKTMGNIIKIKELVEVRIVKGKPCSGASYWAKGYSLLRKAI